MKSAILGVGGVGGLLAAVGTAAGLEPICVTRGATHDLFQSEGLALDSKVHGLLRVKPRSVTHLEQPVDILFVCTKAYSLDEALKRVAPQAVNPDTVVVPLLNGLDHMALLRSRLNAAVVAAIVRVEAKASNKNTFLHTSPFCKLEWAAQSEPLQQRLREMGSSIGQFGFTDVTVKDSESEALLGKLVPLNAIALLTSKCNRSIGPLREDTASRAELLELLKEGLMVARACGVRSMTLDSLTQFVDGLPYELGTSMQRDLHAGRPIELEDITGSLIRQGQALGLQLPTLERFRREIKDLVGSRPSGIGA